MAGWPEVPPASDPWIVSFTSLSDRDSQPEGLAISNGRTSIEIIEAEGSHKIGVGSEILVTSATGATAQFEVALDQNEQLLLVPKNAEAEKHLVATADESWGNLIRLPDNTEVLVEFIGSDRELTLSLQTAVSSDQTELMVCIPPKGLAIVTQAFFDDVNGLRIVETRLQDAQLTPLTQVSELEWAGPTLQHSSD